MLGHHLIVKEIWEKWLTKGEFPALSGGHFIPEEAPNQASQILLEFLREI